MNKVAKYNFACAVILFNPTKKNLNEIALTAKHFEKLYIIDNTETSNPINSYFKSLNSHFYFHDKKNRGISEGLNICCEMAYNDGFDYLLTMDQDSSFDELEIIQYKECIINFCAPAEISMYGVNHEKKIQAPFCTYNETNFIITSGSIINLHIFKKVGNFDENLFIDFVDTEYCFRSIRKGFKIIEFPNIYMHHNLGTVHKKYSLKTFTKTSRSFHSSTRLYYMYRNFLYLQSEYKNDFKNELAILKKDLLNRIKNKLLYTPNRISTIKLLLKAKSDFKKNRMGKLPD